MRHLPFRFVILIVSLAVSHVHAQQAPSSPNSGVLRIGMIGLDTSHAPAFAKLWNSEKAEGLLAKQQIVAAFPGGSPDIESSISRVPNYTKELASLGVKMVDSVDELVSQVDAVIIHSLDGRKHLEQAIPALRARKPLFIDKPLAGSLTDAVLIDMVAKKFEGKWFSSSSLRFSPGIWKYRSDAKLRSDIHGAMSWSPCSLESTHPDLFWYGIHGVESLYTVMGTGCQSVSRTTSPGTDVVVGHWSGGRFGIYRGNRDQIKSEAYGLVVFGANNEEIGGKYEGYAPLVAEVAKFFDGAPVPVAAQETIEMFAFMEAADESKRKGGAPIKLSEVLEKANLEANQRIGSLTN
ncbi:MAG: Gfo/Idh/MocA family oxidoreductase [Pirellula sp.]